MWSEPIERAGEGGSETEIRRLLAGTSEARRSRQRESALWQMEGEQIRVNERDDAQRW